MKRLMAFVLVITAVLGAYVWYQGQSINPNDVIQINIYEADNEVPQHSYFATDKDAIEQIVGIFNDMEGDSATALDSGADADAYSLDIITDEGTMYNYDLTIDLPGLKLDVYDKTNEQYLYPSYEQVKQLLSMEGFYDIYETAAPTVQITYSTMTIPAQVTKSQWVFTLADGTPMDRKAQLALDPSEATIPLNPDHPLQMFSEKKPDKTSLKVYADETLIRDEVLEGDAFLPTRYDGLLRYDVTSQWKKSGELDAYGTSTVSFYGSMDLVPELTIDKTTATAGDVIVLEIFNINDGQVPTIDQNLTKDLKIWKSDDRYFAFLAMDYWAKPGTYDITLKVEGQDGFEKTYPVTIASKEFKKQYLTVDKNVESSTRNDAAYEEYAKYFTPVRDESENRKLWEGPFIQPVEGRISTEFGEMRYVNGALTSYRHSGIDIAAPRGTEIVAPNTGIVKLSRNLILTGETIVIDHGYGIFSVYFHMDSRSADVGQTVTKGQLIGTVGSTGFSTGPHLHWTMSHYKTNLSPWLFLDRELITFE